MKILSIETASNNCSVAILEDNKLIKELSVCDENTHSQKLMPLIDSILKETNLSLSNIDLFACDKGPGSFTGIRIGIATLKAFHDVLNKPIIGISALDAFANLIMQEAINNNSYICSIIDAKHENVYGSIYEKNGEKLIQLQDYFFKNIHELCSSLNQSNKFIFFVGNGSIVYEDVLKSKLQNNAKFFKSSITAYNIGYCAFLEYNSNNNFTDIDPLYIKKSSAEIELEAKINANS